MHEMLRKGKGCNFRGLGYPSRFICLVGGQVVGPGALRLGFMV